MKNLSLVLGANGHLGNNLVRELLKRAHKVRACVRNLSNRIPFEGLDCQMVKADLMDKSSLKTAMMLLAAHIMQLKSKITKKQPMMMPQLVKSFYRAKKRYDTSKAKSDLGFNPRPQIAIIKEKMRSVKQSTVQF